MTCDNRRGQARVSSHCCTETMSRKMERKEERDGNEKRRGDDTSASANCSTQHCLLLTVMLMDIMGGDSPTLSISTTLSHLSLCFFSFQEVNPGLRTPSAVALQCR